MRRMSVRAAGVVSRIRVSPDQGELQEGGRMTQQLERRSNQTVDFVRDWITSLRLAGGDFDERAAAEAGRAALAARRSGHTEADVFETARNAYYNALHRL